MFLCGRGARKARFLRAQGRKKPHAVTPRRKKKGGLTAHRLHRSQSFFVPWKASLLTQASSALAFPEACSASSGVGKMERLLQRRDRSGIAPDSFFIEASASNHPGYSVVVVSVVHQSVSKDRSKNFSAEWRQGLEGKTQTKLTKYYDSS